jgi:hypothetical protein
MVEIAEEFIEAMHRRQHLVAVAEMVLAELARHIAERLEQGGDCGVFRLHAFRRAWQADFGEASADRRLPGDESGAASGAALLSVPVGECRPFCRKAVDVGRLVAHHPAVIGTDVELPDIVAPDHQDVRFLVLRSRRLEYRAR